MRPAVLPVLFALTLLPPVGAWAEPLNALTGGGRYQLMEVNDKIVRLDTKTGRFDICHMDASDWSCVGTRDQRVELEARVAELTRRIGALEAERAAAAVVAPAPAASTPATPAPMAQAPVQPTAAPVVVGTLPQPVAPAAASANPSSNEFEQVADVVPPVEVGRKQGQPMVIAPAQQAAAPEKKPGLVKRLTGLLPDFDW